MPLFRIVEVFAHSFTFHHLADVLAGSFGSSGTNYTLNPHISLTLGVAGRDLFQFLLVNFHLAAESLHAIKLTIAASACFRSFCQPKLVRAFFILKFK